MAKSPRGLARLLGLFPEGREERDGGGTGRRSKERDGGGMVTLGADGSSMHTKRGTTLTVVAAACWLAA